MSSDAVSSPRSFRLSATTAGMLDRRADDLGESRNALVERLLAEGLRREEHPLVYFRGNAAGVRTPAALPRKYTSGCSSRRSPSASNRSTRALRLSPRSSARRSSMPAVVADKRNERGLDTASLDMGSMYHCVFTGLSCRCRNARGAVTTAHTSAVDPIGRVARLPATGMDA